MTVKTKKSSR